VPVHRREQLSPGTELRGPAIVEQPDTTTVIYPGHRAVVDSLGNIVIEVPAVAEARDRQVPTSPGVASLDPVTLEVLRGSDEVVVVSELTVPALLAARALSDELEPELLMGAKPRIVLNRLASRMFGLAPSLAEAERALQRKADGAVSSDWEAAAASVNLGGAISHHRPKSKIVRDVTGLVDRLLIEAERDPKLTPRAA